MWFRNLQLFRLLEPDALAVEGTEGLVGRLEKRLVVGQPEAINTWMLLLELYQRLGNQENRHACAA